MALRHFLPKRPAWLLATTAAALAAVTAYSIAVWRGTWTPGRTAGLVMGSAAASLVLLDALYPLRRRLIMWPFRNTADWLQLHLYGGGLACLLALLHVGFRWPAGRLGWAMAVTGAWAVASGIAGAVLQKHLPAVLATELTVEIAFERIAQRVAQLRDEADQLVAGSPEMVQRVYGTEIRPALASLQPSYSYLVEVGTTARRLAPLRGLQAFVPEAERARIDDLAAIVNEKHQLDVQYSLQRVLRRWLIVHVPVTYLFVGLLLLHLVLVLSF